MADTEFLGNTDSLDEPADSAFTSGWNHVTPNALLEWQSWHEDSPVVLCCQEGNLPRVEKNTLLVVWDGCLSEASPGLAAQLLLAGASQVFLSLETCAKPQELSGLLTQWQEVCAAVEDSGNFADSLVKAYSPPPRDRLRTENLFEVAAGQVSRRSLLGFSAELPDALDKDLTEARRSAKALGKLAAQGRIASRDVYPCVPSPGVGLRVDGETCNACQTCVKTCPEGALSLTFKEKARLSFSRLDCSGCLRCLELCEPEAIRADMTPKSFDAKESREVLAEMPFAECQDCRALFHGRPGETRCDICSWRVNNPFGSRLPRSLLKWRSQTRRQS